MFIVEVRYKFKSLEQAERGREFLEAQLKGLSLDAPRKGTNPKYKDRPPVWFCYGTLEVPEKVRGESGRLKQEELPPRKRRKRNASGTKKTRAQKVSVKVEPKKPEPNPFEEAHKRLSMQASLHLPEPKKKAI